ncbi:DUF4124 domain-containing protein [Andreprevotia lacus]|uniref:DUF4124 domain-containing protein n=1 Tax=Andreprevotia lacus TaxID=1121000 RepID=UPI00159334D7|nr:DUF4124 domain-containing protein [Andreprevotia lacus]
MLTVALLVLHAIPLATAKVYQWRDADGNVYYADQPPPGQAARERNLRSNIIGSGNASGPKKEAITSNYAVTLYISQGCGLPCEEALSLLDGRRVEYEVKTIGTSEAEMVKFVGIVGSMNARPPVMVIGSDVYKTWDRTLWSAALSKAGFKVPQR